MELSAHRLRCQGKTCRNQGGKPESPGSDIPIPWENGESSDIERRAMVLILSLQELCSAFSRRIYARRVYSEQRSYSKYKRCDFREGEAPADASTGKDVVLPFRFGGSLTLPFSPRQQLRCPALRRRRATI